MAFSEIPNVIYLSVLLFPLYHTPSPVKIFSPFFLVITPFFSIAASRAPLPYPQRPFSTLLATSALASILCAQI